MVDENPAVPQQLQRFSPALRYIVTTILHAEPDDLIVSAMNGENMRKVVHLVEVERDYNVDVLAVTSGPRNQQGTIPPHQRITIQRLQKYAQIQMDASPNSEFPEDDEWLALTATQLRHVVRTHLAANPTTTNVTSSVTARSTTLAQAFEKGIKRDPTAFPVLKVQKRFVVWQKQLTHLVLHQEWSLQCNVEPEKNVATAAEQLGLRQPCLLLLAVAD
jgi:hypothetical protein